MAQPVIALYTDFGLHDPYVGQMHAAIQDRAPGTAVVDLHHYAPVFAPAPAGLLLEALVPFLPRHAVVAAVVDPGVGTERGSLALWSRGHWFVGPDNGLLSPLLDEPGAAAYRLAGDGSSHLSASFHGRDLFAPAACELARGDRMVLGDPVAEPVRLRLERGQVIYADHYGNLITGLPVPAEGGDLRIGDRVLPYVRTFGEAPPGEAFWYRNSLGLAEVAVREASALDLLGVAAGTPVTWSPDGEG
ncbi:MAG TPA: SAM-dependent chlorinase/fluorinase [Gammaproteobacteria bacterium]|nr:SAM-dependent chlorinase/fluorinase [Gammaproteobacteria bacterium]